MKYPVTRRDESVCEDHFGTKVPDPYRWLEDADSKETAAWVAAQNEVTDAYLNEMNDVRDPLREKLTSVFNYERYGCPFKRGDRYFFYKNDGLQNQSVLYVQSSLETKESVFLDPNKLSEDGTTSLAITSFSENGEYMAYGVSVAGSDWRTVYVKRVEDATDLEDKLDWIKFTSMAWTHDNKGFFYSKFPAAEVNDKGTEVAQNEKQEMYYHRLGTAQTDDVLVYRDEEHPKWMFSPKVTGDGNYLLVYVSESTDNVNGLYWARLNEDKSFTKSSLNIVRGIDSFEAEYSYVTNEESKFYFKSNLNAPRGKVIMIDINDGELKHEDVIPQHEKDVLTEVHAVNETQLLVMFLHDVKEILQLYDLNGKCLRESFPTPTFGTLSVRAHRKQSEFFYFFSSFCYAGVIYRHDLRTDESSIFRQTKISGIKPDEFTTKQVFFDSKDGTSKIPMYIIHRKNLKMDGSAPTLLYGYGGFNISLLPSFSVTRLCFAQYFNAIVAIPNLRGGGEYGEEWHKQGVKHLKQNVFDDFFSAAEYLIENKYTISSKIAINGGSNGGLLVGACITQRPNLFGCGVAAVGVMDMLRFHKFTIGHFWCSDYGNADENEESFKYLYAYSPLHNVKPNTEYPPLLLTTADHDDRVVPLHSFKLISTFQHTAANNKHPLLIRIECKAGHGAGKPLTKIIDEYVDVFAFMARSIGCELVN